LWKRLKKPSTGGQLKTADWHNLATIALFAGRDRYNRALHAAGIAG
jgi:hypothetical protein